MNTAFLNAAVQMSVGNVQSMDVHSENLANSSIAGYKRLESSSTSFSDELKNQVYLSPSSKLAVNHTQGALRSTGRSLDLAIDGSGFFVVSKDGQDFYTRNGNFRISPEGTVVNNLGMPLQTTSGDFQLPAGAGVDQIRLDDQLNLSVDGSVIAQLKIAAVEDPSKLESAGTTLFVNNGVQEVDSNCNVVSGFLEQSNTAVFEEMVGMMTTLRNYEACQRMLRTVDEMDQKMISKLT